MISVGIITLSDSCAAGEQEDLSGKVIQERVKEFNGTVEFYKVLPDDYEMIVYELIELVDKVELDLILTTGGTGLAPRDVTPEATKDIIDKAVPGISETIRNKSLEKTPKAMLSRGIAGIRKNTLIINLPGSPKAVDECMDIILPIIPHSIELINDDVNNCARD
jgi:molybdenum cofactor synthesis domain-containing protein